MIILKDPKDKSGDGKLNNYFHRREFSFTLPGDIYCRYLCFRNSKEFKDHCIKERPIKMDIGAIFNAPPDQKNSIGTAISNIAFKAEEKEFVIDIDMTDYDPIRTCCSGTAICIKCWKFMQGAVKVLNRALKEDFGFKHILWVFSGRRGIHCWVCDYRARQLTNEGRSAVAEYLGIVAGTSDMKSQVKKHAFSPQVKHSVAKAVTLLSPFFIDVVINDQKIFSIKEKWDKVLDLIHDEKIRQDIAEKVHSGKLKGKEKWDLIRTQKNQNITNEIILTYLYPRIDIHVSKTTNHLLKAPFCIHPKTGKVCVPLQYEDFQDFNPHQVPTLVGLVKNDENEVSHFKRCIVKFQEFIAGVEKDDLEQMKRERKRLIQEQNSGNDF